MNSPPRDKAMGAASEALDLRGWMSYRFMRTPGGADPGGKGLRSIHSGDEGGDTRLEKLQVSSVDEFVPARPRIPHGRGWIIGIDNRGEERRRRFRS